MGVLMIRAYCLASRLGLLILGNSHMEPEERPFEEDGNLGTWMLAGPSKQT